MSIADQLSSRQTETLFLGSMFPVLFFFSMNSNIYVLLHSSSSPALTLASNARLSVRSWMGKTNREVSDSHPTLLTPSGWSMGIWPVIFGAETLFMFWQSRAAKGQVETVSPWFAIACIFQALWSVTFARELVTLSAVLLPVIAICLTVAVWQLSHLKARGNANVLSLEYWALHFPIGLHAGWTTAASFVMVNMALEAQPLETRVAALLVAIIVAPLAALLVALVFDDQAYLCAIAWALAAIADKSDFRRTTLPSAVADGVNRALSVLWVTLLVFGALVVLASKLWKEQGKCAAGDSEEKAGIASSKAKKSD
ncbi:unnamed protein product [Ascophyllum nodosum]